MQTNKLANDAQNYVTPVTTIGDIVYQVDDDDNQNNYQKLSNHVAKFSNQAAFRTTKKRYMASHMNANKWMDRLMGHKRYWGKFEIENLIERIVIEVVCANAHT